MKFPFYLVPEIFIELVARTAGFFAVLFRPRHEEALEKFIRGFFVGLKFGGSGCWIGRNVLFQGRTGIKIGNKVSINRGTQLIAGTTGHVTLGNHSHISRNSVLAGAGGITIGEHCKISSGVMIYTVTYDRQGDRLLRDCPSKFLPVTMGNDVHVGANATILPGVSIGDNAVIGAGAVVTKDVAAGVTVVGVPAKPI